MRGPYISVLRIVLHGRSAGSILLATLLSFSFSIAVILCTFGLMDGFDHLLKTGLRHSSGDILITSRKGFFSFDENLKNDLNVISPLVIAPVIQTEAFALHAGKSKGVLVRGVESELFARATGLKVYPEPGGIIIGAELADFLNVKIGDELAVTFGRGNETSDVLPGVKLFKITDFVKHGIYQKDLRFVYINRDEIASLLDVGEKINLAVVTIADATRPLKDLEEVQNSQVTLRKQLQSEYIVRPFWNEYSFLIEAVKVEKLSISIILQLIVLVAVFNILAFVIYIMEKKAQEFFFLRAVGLSLSSLMRFWLISILGIWGLSCVGAYFLSKIFNWGLGNLTFLQIPGEIYVLSSLGIRLDFKAYFTVYFLSLLWIILAAIFGYFRLRKRPIIDGLRQEFSS